MKQLFLTISISLSLISCNQREPPKDMVLIPAGTFLMGSPSNEAEREENELQHEVTVSSFYMDKYEITQEEWKRVFAVNPSRHRTEGGPVDWVNWNMVLAYCNMRSIEDGYEPVYELKGYGRFPVAWKINSFTEKGVSEDFITHFESNGYRLPTEAEWEYAARAGTNTAYINGNDLAESDANWKIKPKYSASLKVGLYPPNAFGLYDMSGNVLEWTNDWFAPYEISNKIDPRGPAQGELKVLRGASWGSLKKDLRLAYRNFYFPHKTSSNIGFRMVKNLALK